MCETHINDAIRKKLEVKKVTSSHKKGETVIISKTAITREETEAALADSGYRVTGFICEPYEKKGLFGR